MGATARSAAAAASRSHAVGRQTRRVEFFWNSGGHLDDGRQAAHGNDKAGALHTLPAARCGMHAGSSAAHWTHIPHDCTVPHWLVGRIRVMVVPAEHTLVADSASAGADFNAIAGS